MINTTICYIEKDGAYLMLHRTKKKNDINEGKWIGIGGKFEEKESPIDCVRREVLEETALSLKNQTYRGVVTFVYGEITEIMHLFTSDSFEGTLTDNCTEGELRWVKKEDVLSLNLWEGDKIFLDILNKETPFFSLKLIYDKDNLIESHLDFC